MNTNTMIIAFSLLICMMGLSAYPVEFASPTGIAVDEKGFIYVVDSINCNVQKFDSMGKYVTKWGSKGKEKSQFDDPSGIALDKKGYIYVADRDNERIQKFDSNGKYIAEWKISGYSKAITIDSKDSIYVVTSNRTKIFDSTVEIFDSKGELLAEWDLVTGEKNKIGKEYQGISVDTKGNIYITEFFNDCIYKLNSSGIQIDKIGSSGELNGQFMQPHGITVDVYDNLYVADSFNCRIQKLNTSGKFIEAWKIITSPLVVAVDTHGFIYIGGNDGHILKIDSSGKLVKQWYLQVTAQ